MIFCLHPPIGSLLRTKKQKNKMSVIKRVQKKFVFFFRNFKLVFNLTSVHKKKKKTANSCFFMVSAISFLACGVCRVFSVVINRTGIEKK
jgi:hypothetical protein